MESQSMKTILLATCLVLASLPAAAATLHFHANLLAASEVPPTGTSGKGSVDATLDTTTGKLDYTVSWAGLTGPATMAHFHGPAPVGKNAGVQINLGANPVSPLHGSATLTAAQETALQAGQLYVNVHTAAHKGGEIRGQLLPEA
jgi:hypothetical protein